MGLFSFIKEAGKKIFHSGDDARKENPAITDDAIRQQQVAALRAHVQNLGLNIKNLDVRFDAADGEVVLSGEARSMADYEKAALMAGNVSGIFKVDNQMTIAASTTPQQAPETQSDTYEVKKGDTLWAIADKYYGNGAQYKAIVEANQPMIKDENEIYPGQTLRIPKLNA
ncbi:MAG: peptidoglycan-binding protein LysM [Sphingobacteriales bacterium]|nr:MAG: peptidoglycan-binding protein LysM [Sphingobacteriales bacterium]